MTDDLATDEPAAAEPVAGEPGKKRFGRVRQELAYLAELAGISGFAVVQPILSPFGESPETILVIGADPGQIVRFALLVALAPALLLWLLVLPTRLGGPTVRRLAQAVVVGLLAVAAATVVARGLGAPAWTRIGAALLVGVGIGLLRAGDRTGVRLFLRFTAPVPLLLVVLFLFASPVAPLVRPAETSAVDTSEIDTSEIDTSVDQPPVVVLILDELPTSALLDGNGAIDVDRFPNIARVAASSTWYRNHTSGAASTLQSLPVLLTGRLPEDAGDMDFPIYDNYPENLFTLLGDTYEVNAHEHGTRLCPRSVCKVGEAGTIDDKALDLTVVAPEPAPNPVGALVSEAWSMWGSEAWPLSTGFDAGYTLGGRGEVAIQEVVADTLRAVSSIREPSGDKPVFDYVHFGLPHQPWYLLPSGRTHDAPEIPFGNEFMRYWPEGRVGLDLAQAGEMQMQLQLQWADRAVGAIIDRLEALDRWDEALVVLTADHGISFEPGTSARVAFSNNQRSLAWVPLFVKRPGQTVPETVDDTVMALDLLPTIIDVLDIEAPWELEGLSLLDGPPPADRRRPFVIVSVLDTDFETMLRDRIAILDADGLTPLLSAGRDVDPDDKLGAWRHGRLGDLIGEDVEDLGVCRGMGPAVDVDLGKGWRDLVAGRLDAGSSLPLWHQGTIDSAENIDVAAAVDGRIVAWGVTDPLGGDERLGLLFAEPLVRTPTSDPTYYEVVDGSDCRLRRLAGQTVG